MRITGKGVWGPPDDPEECIRVLRRLVEFGDQFHRHRGLLRSFRVRGTDQKALHPYPDGLVIATKAGLLRTGPDEWPVLGFPAYLRQECEMSLRRLGVDTIDLFQLHRIDDKFPAEEQVGELVKLAAGRQDPPHRAVRGERRATRGAQKVAPIVSVQNMYNLSVRNAEPVLDACESQNIGFIPWFPLAAGPLAAADGPLQRIAADHDASPSQLALAWLLKRSPVMLPIPGTSKVAHLEENVAAASIELTDEEFDTLSKAGSVGLSNPASRQYGGHVTTDQSAGAHPGGGFNPPVPTTKGGPDYGRFVEAVRSLQDHARAADAPDDVITEAADLVEKVTQLLAPYYADEWASPSGRRMDLPNRGNILAIPLDLHKTVDGRIEGTAMFRRFHLGRNGAAHGGAVAQLFDGLLGYTAFTLSGSRAQRTAFLHVDYRKIAVVERQLQVDARHRRHRGPQDLRLGPAAGRR